MISKSKNVVTGGFRNIKGNIHIGDIYYSESEQESSINYFEGLPAISSDIGIPKEPFIGLRWFSRSEARIFFGRGRIINQLFNLIGNEFADKIILLFGQSGVGKSSLLNAGLLPRIEAQWDALYHRRSLNSTLDAFVKDKVSLDIDSPKIVVLDQVEEAFTNPKADNPNEITETIKHIKKSITSQSKTRFILSFRKEYLSEFELILTNHELNYTKLFIEPLCKEDVVEAITGVERNKNLNSKFNLTIEPKLPELIADEILRDEVSNVAPALQVLLTKLWNLTRHNNPNSSYISEELFKKYIKNTGVFLAEFVDEQFKILRKRNLKWVNTGLSIDILKNFVTKHKTSASHPRKNILALYAHIDGIDSLITELKDLYLLTEDINPENDNNLRLGHDSLAQLIDNKYHSSNFPGQKARIILENRLKNSERDSEGNLIYNPLDKIDLEIVEKGQYGMRVLTTSEKELIRLSREKKRKEEKRRKVLRLIAIVSIAVIVFLGVFSFLQYRNTKNAKDELREKINTDAFKVKQRFNELITLADKANEDFYIERSLNLLSGAVDFLNLLTDDPNYNVFIDQVSKRYGWYIYLRNYSSDIDSAKSILLRIANFDKRVDSLTIQNQSIKTSLLRIITKKELSSFEERLTPKKPKMRLINGGVFMMGSDDVDVDYDEDPHIAKVNNFEIGLYEVSFDEYIAYALLGGNLPSDDERGRGSHPVVNIQWFDAIRYCNWLSKINGFEPVYNEDTWMQDLSKNGYRLPTEAEWEYAAAGGSVEKTKFAGTNSYDSLSIYANHISDDDSFEHAAPQGSFEPNALGLYDMIGNVWEWCYDWYGDYPQKSDIGYVGPKSGDYKIVRGCSWNRKPKFCRTSNRGYFSPDVRFNSIGFRLARTP